MNDTIWAAIISGLVTLAVCMINNYCQRKAADRQHKETIAAADKKHQATIAAANEQHNTTIALIEYKLDRLEKKVDLHNNAVERLYKAEKALEVQDERIKVANHRIDDLEKGGTHHD